MVESPATDKVRFIDTGLVGEHEKHDAPWVHTVEVSDNRSIAHFVTIFCRGKLDVVLKVIEPLMELVDLTHHSPAIYHRDDSSYSWIDKRFNDKNRLGWGYHFHWRFDHQPGEEDVKMVLDAMRDGVSGRLRGEIETYFLPSEGSV